MSCLRRVFAFSICSSSAKASRSVGDLDFSSCRFIADSEIRYCEGRLGAASGGTPQPGDGGIAAVCAASALSQRKLGCAGYEALVVQGKRRMTERRALMRVGEVKGGDVRGDLR